MATPTRSVLLYKTEGSMDKAYGLQITPAPGSNDLYHLYYLNGRRGASMKSNPKLADPVTKQATAVALDVANKEFEKVLKAKMKDGYTEDNSGLAYSRSEDAGRVSGYRPQLPADLPVKDTAAKVRSLLESDAWGLQEKKDGEHRGLIISANLVTGTNKNGLIVDIPSAWQDFAALAAGGELTLCGEHMRDGSYAVFDLFDKTLNFSERYAKLVQVFAAGGAASALISLVPVATGEQSKRSLRASVDKLNGEGVVFKNLYASFEEGKNDNSFREKFWADMTCFVLAHNAKRSVSIGAADPATGLMQPLGNVTIPENQDFPPVGALLDVRYLYRFEGGSLEQPTSKGVRTDVSAQTVTTAQIVRIKHKYERLDTGDMSAQMKARLALTEFDGNMALLANYLSADQCEMLLTSSQGATSMATMTAVQELAQRITTMPKTYDTEFDEASPTAHLRYYLAQAEWLITEKDKGSSEDASSGAQHQAFGSADMGYGPELGYISIAEIVSNGGVLDMSFCPVTLAEHEAQKEATHSSSQTPGQ